MRRPGHLVFCPCYEADPTWHLETSYHHYWHPEQPILQLHQDYYFGIDDICTLDFCVLICSKHLTLVILLVSLYILFGASVLYYCYSEEAIARPNA
jgi:hypothetical protein